MPRPDATQRFSSRVADYVRYRPGYPPEVLDLLQRECGLTRQHVIADIGSGTGLLTCIFLQHGNRVFGIEPNADMRAAGERELAKYPNFTSVAGTAEATTLAAHGVDFITAAQAAHWFDRAQARGEFVRILKPGGWVVLLWNERRTDSTPFLRAYEQLLLEFGTDYQDIRHEHTQAEIHEFFAPSPFQARSFEIFQHFDYAGVEGRLLSSSYTPPENDPRRQPMLQQLRRIFDTRQSGGGVVLEYDTRVYYGKL